MLHRGKQGKLVIVSVLFATADAVMDNLFLKSIWEKMPGYGSLSGAMLDHVSPLEGLPSSPDFFAYAGSLTSPPCQEKVVWMVMKQPAMASFKQILKMREALRLDDKRSPTLGNARPTVDAAGRMIYDSSIPTEVLNDVPEAGCVQIDAPSKLSKERLNKSQKLTERASKIAKDGDKLIEERTTLEKEVAMAKGDADLAAKALVAAQGRADASGNGDNATAVNIENAKVEASMSEKNAKLAVQKLEHVKYKEFAVKGKVKSNQKAAKVAVQDAIAQTKASALTEQIRRECKSETEALKNDYKARHMTDVDIASKDQESANKALDKAALSDKKLKEVENSDDGEIQRLRAKADSSETHEKANLKKALQSDELKKEVKSLKGKEKVESMKLEKMATQESDDKQELEKAKKDLTVLNHDMAGEKLTDMDLRGDIKVAQAKAKGLENQLAESKEQAKAALSAEEQKAEAVKVDAHKHEEKVEALKAAAVQKTENRKDLEKIETARRKELTAIKVASKEQDARIQEQAELKAEKKQEGKMRDQEVKLAKAEAKAVAKEEEMAKTEANVEKERQVTNDEANKAVAKEKTLAKAEVAKEEKVVRELKVEKKAAEKMVEKVQKEASAEKVEAVTKAVSKVEKQAEGHENKVDKKVAAEQKTDQTLVAAEEKKVEEGKKKVGKLTEEKKELKEQVKAEKNEIAKEKKQVKKAEAKAKDESTQDRKMVGQLHNDMGKLKTENKKVKEEAAKAQTMEVKYNTASKKLTVLQTRFDDLKKAEEKKILRGIKQGEAKDKTAKGGASTNGAPTNGASKIDTTAVDKLSGELQELTKKHGKLEKEHRALQAKLKKTEKKLEASKKNAKNDIDDMKRQESKDKKAEEAKVTELKDKEEKATLDAEKAKGEAKVEMLKAKDANKDAKSEAKLLEAEKEKAGVEKVVEKQDADKLQDLKERETKEKEKIARTKNDEQNEESKLKAKKEQNEKEEKAASNLAAGSGGGCIKSCPKCKIPEPCPKPPPVFKDLGDSNEKYKKMNEKFLKCEVDASNAVASLSSAKELSDTCKKEKEVCQTKLMEAEQPKPKFEPGPGAQQGP